MIKKIIKAPELYCVLLLVVGVILCNVLQIKVKNVVLTQNGVQQEIALPLLEKLGNGAVFKVSFDVEQKINSPFEMRVVPDDCAEVVTINGKAEYLGDINGHCDYVGGFTLPDSTISKHRNGLTNHFEFKIRNGGGSAGITVFPKEKTPVYSLVRGFTFALLAILFLFLARRFGLSKWLCLLVLIGVSIRCLFFAVTPYTDYANDVDGHVAYVRYIAENVAIPDKNSCWTCYHPPVYYTMAVPSLKIAEWTGVPGTSGLQIFSLVLSVLTLFLGLLLIRHVLKGRALGLAATLWTLWPILIMIAPRIGNDQMFIFLHVFCMWAGINYLEKGRGKYLILAAIATAMAYWTKSTAIVTLGVFSLFAVSGYFLNARSLRPTKSEVFAWILFALTLIGIITQKLLTGSELVGNVNALNHRLMVGNDFANYVYFDLESYLKNPFTSAWNDSLGRQYFWNYALKSSLFGEFNLINTHAARVLASIIGTSLLGLLVYAIRGLWNMKLAVKDLILLLNGIAFIAALMSFRMMAPYACSNDFRYVVPALLSLVVFVAKGVYVEKGSVKWRVLGNALVFVFALSTVILYILAI